MNLCDQERPADVYTAILKLVIAEVEKEQDATWIPVAQSLKGNITRKVIK